MSEPTRRTDLSWLRVLVVDDEPQVVLMVREMLRDMGVTQAFSAKDGREALDFLKYDDDRIHVVMTDWNMPGMSGLDLVRDARSGDPDLAFLLLTGRADQGSVVQARDNGVKAYLKKPFSAQQLRTKLVILSKHVQASQRPSAA